MKILLDENLPKKLRIDLKAHEVHSVQDMNRKGKKNGELLGLMTLAGFEIFVTVDKNLRHQQNLDKFTVIVFQLNSPDSKHKTLQKFIPNVVEIMSMVLIRNIMK